MMDGIEVLASRQAFRAEPELGEGGYPDDPWMIVPPDYKKEMERQAADLTFALKAYYGIPRETWFLEEYLRHAPPSGRLILYPASDCARKVMHQLGKMPDVEVVGVLDRKAVPSEGWEGFRLLNLDDLQGGGIDFDVILVMHPVREPHLCEFLNRHGVSKNRIKRVFTDKLFYKWWFENKFNETYRYSLNEYFSRYRFLNYSGEALDQFIRYSLPKGRYYLYPASDLAKGFLPRLMEMDGYEVVGILDQNADGLEPMKGFPVLRPENGVEEVKSGDYRVLICHNKLEDELQKKLLCLGLDASQIVRLDGRSAPLCLDNIYRVVTGNYDDFLGKDRVKSTKKIRNIVISTSHSRIIGWDVLKCIYSPEETVFLYFGVDSPPPKVPFDCYPLKGSLYFLEEMVGAIKPENIYVGTLIADNWLAMFLKNIWPDAKLIHEIYDLSVHFPNSSMSSLHSVNDGVIDVARCGEYFSIKKSDLVITKRSGALWERALKEFEAPYSMYFQGALDVPEKLDRSRKVDGKLSVVYAGPIPPESVTSDWPFYRFVPLLKDLCGADFLTMDVFNAFHSHEDQDGQYLDFMKRMSSGKGRYHRAKPLQDLLKVMGRYDYGWMCLNRTVDMQDFPDTRTVTSARVTGYVSAGLPIIIDSTWDAAVELVTKFDAGIVIDEPDVAKIRQELERYADPEQHRAGAKRLLKYMLATNDRTVKKIRNTLK